MDVRPIETEADYDWALAEVAVYFDHEPAPGTPDAARFTVLSVLIGCYEDRHWPIEPPDAVSAIVETMAFRGLRQSDLAQLIGSKSRASELLGRKRRLTMEQAWQLHRAWAIPAEVLIQPAAAAA